MLLLLLVDSLPQLPPKVILQNAPLIEPLTTKLEETIRLRRDQLCPIHRSLFCCGRETISKTKRVRQMGIHRTDDPHHPRGYLEIRLNAEIRKLLDKKNVAQNGECAICKVRFADHTDIVRDHINPRGMGGEWRDDHPENIQAVHWWCNGEKGSSRG
jgi:hypothetical protein